MIAKIIQIGNSKGIRIPNQILKEMNIENQIELVISDKRDKIILKPVHKVREGWTESSKKCLLINFYQRYIIQFDVCIEVHPQRHSAGEGFFSVNFKYRKESLLGNFHGTHKFHSLLPLFLLIKKFSFS